MKSVNIHQAKTELSKLVHHLETKGGFVTICRYGKPVAELFPVRKMFSSRKKPPWLKSIKILGDITAPLSEEDWPLSAR